jgi:hypothetical protein
MVERTWNTNTNTLERHFIGFLFHTYNVFFLLSYIHARPRHLSVADASWESFTTRRQRSHSTTRTLINYEHGIIISTNIPQISLILTC